MKTKYSNLLDLHFKGKQLSKSKKRIDQDQATAMSSRRILKTQTGIHRCQTNQVDDSRFHSCLKKKRLCLFIDVRMKIRQQPVIFLIKYSMKHRVQLLFRLIDRNSLEDKTIRAQLPIQQDSLLQPVVELAKEANKQLTVLLESLMTKRRHQNHCLKNREQEASFSL